MANGHGGKRKGSGRKAGSATSETIRRQLAVTREQKKLRLGVELLSELANYCRAQMGRYQQDSPEADDKKFLRFMRETGRYAAAVAVYESSRRASITVREVPYDLSRLSDDELAEFERLAKACADADGAGGGAGEALH